MTKKYLITYLSNNKTTHYILWEKKKANFISF